MARATATADTVIATTTATIGKEFNEATGIRAVWKRIRLHLRRDLSLNLGEIPKNSLRIDWIRETQRQTEDEDEEEEDEEKRGIRARVCVVGE